MATEDTTDELPRNDGPRAVVQTRDLPGQEKKESLEKLVEQGVPRDKVQTYEEWFQQVDSSGYTCFSMQGGYVLTEQGKKEYIECFAEALEEFADGTLADKWIPRDEKSK